MADLACPQFASRDRDFLEGGSSAVVDAKCPVDQQNIEPEKAKHRPCAEQQKRRPCHEANAAYGRHDDEEPGAAEGAMRGDHCREKRWFGRMEFCGRVIAGGHESSI